MLLLQGDCLQIMPTLAPASVDLILCDLPYGTTACKWDTIIPLDALWAEYSRVAHGAIVLTAAQPFTSALVMSNREQFRHSWVWKKTVAANFMLVKKQPNKLHEDILVFSEEAISTYNPQMESGEPYSDKPRKRTVGILGGETGSKSSRLKVAINNMGTRYPASVQLFPNPNNGNNHPTQKPVALMEYLIKTYTNPGDTVLDNCMGSGTTGVACVNTGREFIGIEQDSNYFQIASTRIAIAEYEKACR